jgi:thioredoxin 1
MLQVSSAEFENKVLQSDKPVIVDFYADWCGPCKMLAPIFEELSTEMPSAVFVKVDVERETKLAMEHQVRSIPTLILFKGGEPVERVTGLLSKEQLKSLISKHL